MFLELSHKTEVSTDNFIDVLIAFLREIYCKRKHNEIFCFGDLLESYFRWKTLGYVVVCETAFGVVL